MISFVNLLLLYLSVSPEIAATDDNRVSLLISFDTASITVTMTHKTHINVIGSEKTNFILMLCTIYPTIGPIIIAGIQ